MQGLMEMLLGRSQAKPNPSQKQVPRDWEGLLLGDKARLQQIPLPVVGAAVMGAKPLGLLGTLMDRISPNMVPQDISLPNESGETDPRLKKSQAAANRMKRLV